MSGIDNGIKQPLRFYDSVSKQNFRKSWVSDGGIDVGLTFPNVLICPQNAIVPFQIRRRRSAATITTFDLYTWDNEAQVFILDYSLLTVIPAPITNHLRIIQMENVDNIAWYPLADFTASLDTGLHYVHLSDGTTNWYSEVFNVECFSDNTIDVIQILTNPTVTGSYSLSKDRTTAGEIIASSKPF